MKRVFILYPYYWPNFNAGGPVQSLYNLVGLFSDRCQFFLTSNVTPQHSVDANQASLNAWNPGPHGEVVYLTRSLSFVRVFQLLYKAKPDTLFINGIFTAVTTLPGLFYGALTGKKLIVSPRGMLQGWALKKKGWKKAFYLPLFKLLMPRRLVWHATNEKEAEEIRLVFGAQQRIHVASNIPRKPAKEARVQARKEDEPLKLVFLSLINSNKNLELIIDAMKSLPVSITLDIYGPIADEKYWEKCRLKITDTSRIKYCGIVPPVKVPEVLSAYHYFVLPTLGENFGHAIFDALSIGLPVIISRHTPWSKVEAMKAGFYCETSDSESLSILFLKVAEMPAYEHVIFSNGALEYATQYLTSHDYTQEYKFLIE